MPTRRSFFLSNDEVHLDASARCAAHLATHGMSDELVARWRDDGRRGLALELVFEGERLLHAMSWWDGRSRKVDLDEGAGTILPEHVYRHSLHRLVTTTENGVDRVGGHPPAGFVRPTCDRLAPFQYVATLSSALEGLEWLPFDLHLTLPTLNVHGTLYLDYAEPMRPVLVDTPDSELSGIDDPMEILGTGDVRALQLTLERRGLRSMRSDVWDYGKGTEGHLGIPAWVQGPDVPFCPRDDEPMRFVCEFGLDTLIDPVESRPAPIDDVRAYFSTPSWQESRYATLYVFLAPRSRTVCVRVQGT